MSIGDYVNPTFVNEEDSPGNGTELSKDTFQPMSNKIAELDNELNSSRTFNFFMYLDYIYMRNQKNMEGFQSGWNYDSGYDSSLSNDTSNYKVGTKSQRLTHTSSAEGWNIAYKAVSLNLLKSNMNDDFDTNDYIIFSCYISNSASVNKLQIVASSDAGSNFKYYELTSGFVTGWNYIYFKMSDMVDYNSGATLSSINYIGFRWRTNAGYSGSYVSGQYLLVERKHPVYATRPEIFQEYNGAGWQTLLESIEDESKGIFILDGTGDSYPKPNYLQLDDYLGKNINLGLSSWNCFYLKANFRIKKAGYSPGVRWEKDSNNYLECYLSGSNCVIKKNIAGTPTTTTLAIGGTPAVDTTMLMYITKVNQIFRCIFWFTSYSIKIIEIVDPFLNDIGYMYLICPNSTSYSYLRDLCISNKSTLMLNSGSDLW